MLFKGADDGAPLHISSGKRSADGFVEPHQVGSGDEAYLGLGPKDVRRSRDGSTRCCVRVGVRFPRVGTAEVLDDLLDRFGVEIVKVSGVVIP